MATDAAPGRRLWAATFAALGTAILVVEVGASPESRFPRIGVAVAAIPFALAVLAAALLPRPPAGRKTPPGWAVAVLAGLTAVPFATDFLYEAAIGTGRPFEIRLLAGFGYAALGLAALGHYPACLRLAAVASLFLTLFGLSLGSKPALLWCLAAYAAAGVVWLAAAYQTGLRIAGAGPDVVVTGDGPRPAVGRVPWGLAGVVALLVGLAAAVVAAGPKTVVAPLWELLPSSGGTGDYDRRSRGGVNDGDEETSGPNAAATGMVDTDQFLESPLPSLFDAVSDMHGPPHKPPKEIEKAQAISATVKQMHGRTADGLRPSRTFPTSRQSPAKPQTPLGRAARGLFEVDGPTPLHVRAAVFHAFDGRAWVEVPPVLPPAPRRDADSRWMNVPDSPRPDVFADEPARHSIKVAKHGAGEAGGAGGAAVRLDGTLIPTAPHLTRFRLGKIEREDFFACGADGILRMALRKVPGGVAVETEARLPDPGKLARHSAWPSPADPDFAPAATAHADRVAALAREWAGDHPRGWAQIAAVVARLRDGYALDATAGVPPEHADAAAYFLFESRRGPDYLFATSAASLLRHLGYRTRLAAGFYAAPEGYDPETKHTPVGWENVHVWPEVLAGGDAWVVLEPTPGYAVLTPPRPWHERALAAAAAAGQYAAARPLTTGAILLALVGLVRSRRALADAAAVARWRVRPGRDWRGWVLGAVRLVERRAAWAGRARPVGATPARHFAADAVPADALTRLADMAGWAAYAPAGLAPAAEADVWTACDHAVRVWTTRRFRRPRTGDLA